MSEIFPGAEALPAPEQPTLLTGVLARLDARRAAIGAPTTPTGASDRGATPATPTLPQLRRSLADPRWEVRAAAAHALGALADANGAPDAALVDDACEALNAALHDEHRLVRAASVRALGRLAPLWARDGSARAAFLAQLSGALADADEEPRAAAAYALADGALAGVVATAEARGLLLAATHDVASDVRAAVSLAWSAVSAHETPVALSAVGPSDVAGYAAATRSASDASYSMTTHIPAARVAYRRLALWGAIWLRQTRIMRREVWLVMLCGALAAVTLTVAIRLHGGAYDYAAVVAFILAGASATGVSFLAQAEHDPGLELTLATPASLRFVLGGRIALVVGYNCALAVVASAMMAVVEGQGALAIVQGWVGPMLLVSAVALAISLTVGSATAVCGALLLDITQLLRALPTPLDGAPTVANALGAARLVVAQVWGAHPTTLILVALLIIAAAVMAPQRALEQKEA